MKQTITIESASFERESKIYNIMGVKQFPIEPLYPSLGEIDHYNRTRLRTWWHNILATDGRYSTYGIILTLPADKEAIRYYTDFGNELNLITGKTCLVIHVAPTTISENISTGTSKILAPLLFEGLPKEWELLVKEQVVNGFCVKVAHHFGIPFSSLPCFLLFRDIRTMEHLCFSFKDLTAEAIAHHMRLVFDTVHKSIDEKQDPFLALTQQQHSDDAQAAGKAIWQSVQTYTKKAFETAIEAFIKAAVPSKP